MPKKIVFKKLVPTKHPELKEEMRVIATSGDRTLIASYLELIGQDKKIEKAVREDEDLYENGFYPLILALNNGEKKKLTDEVSMLLFGQRGL